MPPVRLKPSEQTMTSNGNRAHPKAGSSNRSSDAGTPPKQEPEAKHSSKQENAAAGSSSDTEDDKAARDRAAVLLRQREANRLAAQRFRNRKKGYQDSLEERVRVLERERDDLAERLQEVDGSYKRRGDTVWATPSVKHIRIGNSSAAACRGASASVLSSARDDALRLSGVEAANRRLQEELKSYQEENRGLKETVARWVEWEKNFRMAGAYEHSESSSTGHVSDEVTQLRPPCPKDVSAPVANGRAVSPPPQMRYHPGVPAPHPYAHHSQPPPPHDGWAPIPVRGSAERPNRRGSGGFYKGSIQLPPPLPSPRAAHPGAKHAAPSLARRPSPDFDRLPPIVSSHHTAPAWSPSARVQAERRDLWS